MKEGWEYKTLGEVVSFSRGLTYKKSDEVDYSTKVVLRSTNINVDNNSLNIDELKYLNENIEVEEEKLIKKGAILICMSNGSKKHLGKVALIEHDYKYAFGGFMGLLTPVIKINSKYLYYTLTTPKYKEYIKSLSEGANINNLKIKDIQKYIIPIFPLDEQRRIVSYLDSSFKLIDEIKNKALKSLTEAKALFQSALAEAMEPKEGWEEKTLGEVSENIKNINWKNESSAYKYIDLSSVDRDKSIILNTVIVNKTNAPSRAKQLVNKNDIIFATTRPLLRRVTLIEKEYDKSICSTGFCVIRPNSNIIVPKYVFYVFKDEPFYQYIEPLQNGASYPAVTDKAVKSYTFSFPKNVEVQKQIVSRLDKLSSKVRDIEEKYQKMVEECDALKQAMLRDVFE